MKPSRRMLKMVIKAGGCCPSNNPRMSEKVPATSPFQATMVSGSLAEMLRVKLLSTPHRKQARRIPNAPSEKLNPPWKLVERKMLANVIAKMAVSAPRLIDSWKKNKAMSVVPTPSKLSNKEAVEAAVFFKLIIRIMGARMPPEMIAPASHPASGRWMPASF